MAEYNNGDSGERVEGLLWDKRGVAHGYDENGQSRVIAATGWEGEFLAVLRKTGIVAKACKEAGITYKQAYHRRNTDDEFAMEWRMALDEAIESLEEAAWTRARDGVKVLKPIYAGGKYVGDQEITQYSDTLLMFLLKAHKPQMYRDIPPQVQNFNINLVKQAARRMAIEAGFTPEQVEEAEQEAIKLYSPSQGIALPPSLMSGQTAVIPEPAPRKRGRPAKNKPAE